MRQALIIVDMLNDFVRKDGSLAVPGAEEIIAAVDRELAASRRDGDLVVFACDAHDPDDLEFKRYPPHAVAGSPGAQVVEELAPLPHEHVVPKQRLSPFFNTGLAELLEREEVERVKVVGVCTHICVMETVAGLCDRDIAAVVHVDAVADFDQEMAQAALKRMQSVFGAELA